MTSYVRSTPVTVEFDGETITGMLKPLTLGDYLKFRAASGSEAGMVEATMDILPRYVESLSGPHDAAGALLPVEEFSKLMYFLPLTMKLMEALSGAAKVRNPTHSGEESTTSSPGAQG